VPAWWWASRAQPAKPLESRKLALVLAGPTADLENYAPLLRSFVPGVDTVVVSPETELPAHPGPLAWRRATGPIALPDVVEGRSGSALDGLDTILWLRSGETLLTGGDVSLACGLSQQDWAAILIPVHYPWRDGLTLLTLEPRLLRVPVRPTRYDYAPVPVQAAGNPPDGEPPFRTAGPAWALHYTAIRMVLDGRVGPGADRLRALHTQMQNNAPVAGLVLRNLIAIEVGSGHWNRADKLLGEGLRAHPNYGEIRLMQGLRLLAEGRAAEAEALLTALQEAPEHAADGYLSGGGEATYRLLHHRGKAYINQGNAEGAVRDWACALRLEPHFLPPLAAIAEQRLHVDVLAELQLDRPFRLGSPQACELVVRAYARSSNPAAAQALAARYPLAGPPPDPAGARLPVIASHPTDRAAICWEGPFFTESSLAQVNRELVLALMQQQWEIDLLPSQPQAFDPGREPRFEPLAKRLWAGSEQAAVSVSHRFPPAFERRGGRRAAYVPWEFGALPRRWVAESSQVDQVWTYSEFTRSGVIQSGVAPEKVHVVPCGFDPATFHPGVTPSAPVAADFLFLYVGGLILRKGYDLALTAFLQEFAPEEAIVFLFKDFGSRTFYRRQTGLERVRQATAVTAACRRRVLVTSEALPAGALAALYRAATCLVAPYRAEGFGLPILEAMACGAPAIVTEIGPAPEYAPPGTALTVAARPVPVGLRLEGLELVSPGTWAEVDINDLRRQMRWAFEHREELAGIGARAAAFVHGHYTWDCAAEKAGACLNALLER